jgi:hypothetical protein
MRFVCEEFKLVYEVDPARRELALALALVAAGKTRRKLRRLNSLSSPPAPFPPCLVGLSGGVRLPRVQNANRRPLFAPALFADLEVAVDFVGLTEGASGLPVYAWLPPLGDREDECAVEGGVFLRGTIVAGR